jgi:N-acetylglucosamine-6-sulfatase
MVEMREIWLAVVLGTLFLIFGCDEERHSPPPPSAPSMLLILVDDLRVGELGATGHPFFQSPNMDRLVLEGAWFERAFVPTSLCSPSRASVLTGLYAHEHGVRTVRSTLSPSVPTVATALQAAGYRTAWIGKWHLSGTADPFPGFDRWVSFVAQGSYLDPEINIDGTSQVIPGHMTDILTDEALRFLDELEDGETFFLTVSHLAVHTPLTVQDRFLGLYADAPVTLPPSVSEDLSDKPEWLECRQVAYDVAERVRQYSEVLAGVDESVGRLLSKLEERLILDDTLVILLSDNGYHLGEHGLGDKRTAYEESIRVPLFVRYPPWFAPGTRVDQTMALNLDVGSTFLDAASLDPLAGSRGIPLRDLAAGRARRDQFLYHYDRDLISGTTAASCQPTTVALRTRDRVLIRNYIRGGFFTELYDLVADPYQLENRHTDPAFAAEVDSLTSELEELQADLGLVLPREGDIQWH